MSEVLRIKDRGKPVNFPLSLQSPVHRPNLQELKMIVQFELQCHGVREVFGCIGELSGPQFPFLAPGHVFSTES